MPPGFKPGLTHPTSLAYVPFLFSQRINWETLHDPGIAILLDPLHAMDCPYRILDPDASLESC